MSTTHAPTRRFSNIVNAGEADSRRWLVLATICFAALMIVLDVTVMNLALPSAQRALGFTNADRQWIVTAYSLSFGSLLLSCGRLADMIGRKVTFLAGLAGFAAASAAAGASVSFTMLVTARTCQGIFAALLNLGYSAVISGVALLPMVAVIGVMANVGNIVLMPRFGPKPLVILGLLCNAVGMAWLTRIGVHSGYVSALLGPLVATGFGSGLIFSAAASTGTFGVAPHDAGIASASVNAGQQLGGAIGTALLKHDRGQRHHQLPGQPPARTAITAAGPPRADPQLHHGVLVVRRHLRGRRRDLRRAAAPRPADPPPGRTSSGPIPHLLSRRSYFAGKVSASGERPGLSCDRGGLAATGSAVRRSFRRLTARPRRHSPRPQRQADTAAFGGTSARLHVCNPMTLRMPDLGSQKGANGGRLSVTRSDDPRRVALLVTLHSRRNSVMPTSPTPRGTC